MFCKKCGTDNPDDYSFCNNCGFPLMKPESEVRTPDVSSGRTGSTPDFDSWRTGSTPAMGVPDRTDVLGGASFEEDRTVAMSPESVVHSSSRLSEERRAPEPPVSSMGPGALSDGRQLLPKKYKPVNAGVYFLLTLVFSFGVAALYIVFTFIYGGTKNEVLKNFWDKNFLVMIIILGACAACFVINLLLALIPRRVPVKSFARGYLVVFVVNAALLAALAYLMYKNIIHYDVFSKLQNFFII